MPGPIKAEDPKPQPSVRESITAALKETSGEGDKLDKILKGPDDEEEETEEDPDIVDDPLAEDILDEESKSLKAKKKKEAPETEEAEEEIEEVEDLPEEEEVLEAKPLKKTKVAAPDNWKDTADWDKLPPSVRQKIIKREEEVSAGFKQYGDKAKAFDTYEQFIGPRRQSMANIGVTPEQVIGTALDWMDALGHTDPKIKAESFKRLAGNFGIDLASLVPGNASGEGFRVAGDVAEDEIPESVKAYVGTLQAELAGLKQQLGGVVNNFQSQQDRAASQYLEQWASDKPHFLKVQSLMKTLLQSGAVPIKNGTLDLDGAYDMAINGTPELRELVRLEAAEKAKTEAAAKAKEAQKKKNAQLNKARAANGSLKPGSPSAQTSKGLKNGASVRDTLKYSLKQLQSQ